MTTRTENPILLVKPRKADHQQRIIAGFGEPKELVPITKNLRKSLCANLGVVREQLIPQFTNFPKIPAVTYLKLRPEGIAKTHRPTTLLERAGMLPIGTDHLGELLLPTTANSLAHLSKLIAENDSKLIRANISVIEEFRQFGPKDVLRLDSEFKGNHEKGLHFLSRWIKANKPLIVERFASHDSETDATIYDVVITALKRSGAVISDLPLRAGRHSAWVIRLPSLDSAQKLANTPGIRALSAAVDFSAIDVSPQSFLQIGTVTANSLPAPNQDLPVVGVIDTGIRKNDPILSPWVHATTTYVIPPDTDYLHGTFVSGLIAGCRTLNGNDNRFPDSRARIVDVCALASTGTSTFDDLLLAINESVDKYPEVKVWNCSLGSNSPCSETLFGRFASELDAISDDKGVLFVIAAGNHLCSPLRGWPSASDYTGMDRIGQPAESVRGLTVASIAHIDAHVAKDEPSPFSRRGPGPSRTPKPDVTHRGGNQACNGAFNGVGVRSILPGSQLGESIGTSFSTPLVSAMAANVWQALEKKGVEVTPDLVKALLIHAAASHSPKLTADERNYLGFGIPESVMDSLFCSDDTFTMMFQADLFDGINFEKTPFPIPACLHPNGSHFRGEIIMTVVYSPPLNSQHGAEYIRANVDATFGSYDPDHEGKLNHKGLIPMDAPSKSSLYEEALIEHSFKWSPVKVYRGKFQRKSGRNFRLKLELLRRSGELPSADPQRVNVLITFRAIDPDQPVYADGIKAVKAMQWATQSISSQIHINV